VFFDACVSFRYCDIFLFLKSCHNAFVVWGFVEEVWSFERAKEGIFECFRCLDRSELLLIGRKTARCVDLLDVREPECVTTSWFGVIIPGLRRGGCCCIIHLFERGSTFLSIVWFMQNKEAKVCDISKRKDACKQTSFYASGIKAWRWPRYLLSTAQSQL